MYAIPARPSALLPVPATRGRQHAKGPQNVVTVRPCLPQPVVMKVQRVLRLVLAHPSRFHELQGVARNLRRGPQSGRRIVVRPLCPVRRLSPELSLLPEYRGVALGERRRREGVGVRDGFGVLDDAARELVPSLGEGEVGNALLPGLEDGGVVGIVVVVGGGGGGCCDAGGGFAVVAVADAQGRGGQLFLHGRRHASSSSSSTASPIIADNGRRRRRRLR
mmetsp:Transcript_28793/g.69334  ORF Transcript_28793/g.69334 Transcript_28793/m.69334 type:complete len:220 (-) Transcript_28793:1-660(-)